MNLVIFFCSVFSQCYCIFAKMHQTCSLEVGPYKWWIIVQYDWSFIENVSKIMIYMLNRDCFNVYGQKHVTFYYYVKVYFLIPKYVIQLVFINLVPLKNENTHCKIF